MKKPDDSIGKRDSVTALRLLSRHVTLNPSRFGFFVTVTLRDIVTFVTLVTLMPL